jgi:hypothetical protein
VKVASSTKITESIMPSTMVRNAGTGTINTANTLASVMTPENRTALPAVSMASVTAPMAFPLR